MSKRNRYREMERYMTYALATDLFLFVLYLVAAGLGILWFKAITAIIAILLSGLCLCFLYLSQELMKPRSLWMSAASATILICIVFSLILNFPSPNPNTKTIDKETVITNDLTDAP